MTVLLSIYLDFIRGRLPFGICISRVTYLCLDDTLVMMTSHW